MARKKKKKGEKFIGIHGKMYTSPAYESLSTNAKVLLTHFKWLYNGRNNGELAISIKQVMKLCRIGSNKATEAILELLYTGFIKVKKIGRFSTNMASEYSLTCEKMGTREPANDWRHYPENNGNKIRGKNLDEYCKNLYSYLQGKPNTIVDEYE